MKLASYQSGRDGRLMVVSDDLSACAAAPALFSTMQDALDHWSEASPVLQHIADQLNEGRGHGVEAFVQERCAAPLPRAYQIVDGSAYLNHVELVRRARGAEMPPEFLHDPLMYQAVSDTILGPQQDIRVRDAGFGIDFEAEVAVIVDDVPMGVRPDQAGHHIKLVMLMNDVSLRHLIPQELAKGFGFLQSKPPSAFSPVAVTPEALGAAWQDYKLHLPMQSRLNGTVLGMPNAGVDMQFNFAQLIAHAAKTRPLQAGTIIGSGTISNYDRAAGISCLAEARMIETIEKGEAQTPFMAFGDVIEIEMCDQTGQSVFGMIRQTVVKA